MLENRRISDDVLKGRFTKKVLTEQGNEIKHAQESLMAKRTFKSVDKLPRFYKGSNEKLEISFDKTLRFVDMRTRRSKNGIKKKKNHPIHNKIIFGHLNNIIRELSFGYTEATIQEMKSLED